MANLADQIRLLRLSALEIVQLAGWPDALVEDYLNLIDIIASIVDEVDQDTTDVTDLEQTIYSARLSLGKLNILSSGFQSDLAQTNSRIDDLEQLIYART